MGVDVRHYLFLSLILLVGCGQVPPRAPRPKVKAPTPNNQQDGGLRFRLTPGSASSQQEAGKKVATTPLTQSELEAMLKALPPLQGDGKDARAFALRERSLPPPRTARTLDQPFPPPIQNGPPPTVNAAVWKC